MALPPVLPRVGKSKQSLPPHYYEGFLEKKGPQDKGYKKFWTGLRGLTLYFYNTSRDAQYVEKLDLDDFVSLTDARSGPGAGDDGLRLSLKLKGREVKLKAESLEAREMWKGFVLTVVEMKVPSNLTLLPGHIYMMSEVLSKEQERRAQLKQRPSESSLAHKAVEEEMPDCYFKVSRTEAQVLLEKNPDCGNMLLRPGGDGKSISVTTRQILNSTPVIKHYRVSCLGREYVIDVEQPHHCSSLAEVVEYFVSNTKKTLVPLCLDQDYAEKLEFVEMDKENGESLWKAPAFPCPKPPKGAIGRAIMPPFPRKPLVKSPPPGPSQVSEEEEEEDEQTYMNDKDVEAMKQTKPKPFGQCLEPSSIPPHLRKDGSSSSRLSCVGDLSSGISEELARKLEERRAALEN
ncbi:signal-transducing adaptor protein 2 isoform X2 [Emydura macquarii macquarii]|uniref:signal-transducing adaptor protein 2 isoform X2 n=1 Tax=Emydura macquarii macquarii TaxID=1129001 RepID=UPI00352B55B0